MVISEHVFPVAFFSLPMIETTLFVDQTSIHRMQMLNVLLCNIDIFGTLHVLLTKGPILQDLSICL